MGILGWRNGTRHEPRTKPTNGQTAVNYQQKLYVSSLLDQANQPAYRQRLVGKNVGIAYEQPSGTEPCLLSVGTVMTPPEGVMPWRHINKDGIDYVELKFANGISVDRNRLKVNVTAVKADTVGVNADTSAEPFLPSAVICTRRKEFADLADRVAGLIMRDMTMQVRMEDYYTILNKANKDLEI
ncbi:MAG: hypothetical protein HY362_03295 [Candidatus Aenigmarchaeota archaeon]|nr:hypothetical protein [Candidatus Aenigmarchaeota archaeon]